MREARGMKTALVCGAGGFIGGHLVEALKREGFWVRGVDLKSSYREVQADDFIMADLRDMINCRGVIDRLFDEAYQSRPIWGRRLASLA